MLGKDGVGALSCERGSDICVYICSLNNRSVFTDQYSAGKRKKTYKRKPTKKIYFASVAVLLLSARGCEILDFSLKTPRPPGKKNAK